MVSLWGGASCPAWRTQSLYPREVSQTTWHENKNNEVTNGCTMCPRCGKQAIKMSQKRKLLDVEQGRRALSKHGFSVATDDNIHDVHFLMPGPKDTAYDGGLYHGMLRLDDRHPMYPPTMHMFTPTGRFEPTTYPVQKKERGICTTNTVFHANEWSPLNNVETMLIGFQSFMADESPNAIKSLSSPHETRKKLAADSHRALSGCPVVARLFGALK